MKYFVKTFILLIILISVESLKAQSFNKTFTGFSKKKPAYFEKQDGTKIEGYLMSAKKKDGLFETIKIKKTTGEKIEINASSLSSMYLAPSAYATMENILIQDDELDTLKNQTNIDLSLIKDGYVFFEKVPTILKDETAEVMLQLLNPHFSSRIRVYDNPFSENSMIAIGSISLMKGARSYYIRKTSDSSAYKLYSWDYAEKFPDLFGDSEEFMSSNKDNPIWVNLEKNIYDYTLLMDK